MTISRRSIGALCVAAVLAAGSVGVRGQEAAESQRVLVVPFAVLNVPESQQWISRGVQENLVADFGRTPTFSPIAFQGQVIVEDNGTAARLAKQASAAYAVRGAAQMVGENVRLTAQLIDAKTGDTVSTASVTGPTSTLLKMEDELSAQLRGVSSAAPAVAVAPAAAPAAQQVPVQPQVIVITQPAAPSYQPPPYPPGYPAGYVGGYPFGYAGGLLLPIIINDGHHHRGNRNPRFEIHEHFTPGGPGTFTAGPIPGGIVPLPGGGSFGTIQINPAPTPQAHFFSQPQGLGARTQFVSTPARSGAVRTGR
jgi:TolB-like protein